MITSLDQLDFDKKYTYSDYILWKFTERVELYKGRIFPISTPSTIHQEISFIGGVSCYGGRDIEEN
jgi:hypothetical protein